MRLDLSNSVQVGDWVEVRDVRSIADQGVRAQIVADLEAFARDPQAKTVADVLNAVGVASSSLSMRHPTSRTHDLRDSHGRVQVGHLSDAAYGALLDHVKRLAPRWLAELRDQAAEAAKVARATARSLALQPMLERELLAKAMGLQQEAGRAGRAAIQVKAALGWQRQPAGVLAKAVFLGGGKEPQVSARPASSPTLTKATTAQASAVTALRQQAAQLRCQAAILGTVDPEQEQRLLVEAAQVDAQIRRWRRYQRCGPGHERRQAEGVNVPAP